MRYCLENHCDKKHIARGYCDKHYRNHKRIGDLPPSTQERRLPIINGDLALVPIGLAAKDGWTKIDARDAELVDRYLWCMSSKGYALTSTKNGHLHLHHLIAGKPKKGNDVDHINRDKLDNRRRNLRHISHHGNTLNSGEFSHNTSGVRGVCWEKRRNKWVARMKINNKEVFLGYFTDKNDAIKVRNEAWNEHVRTVTLSSKIPE